MNNPLDWYEDSSKPRNQGRVDRMAELDRLYAEQREEAKKRAELKAEVMAEARPLGISWGALFATSNRRKKGIRDALEHLKMVRASGNRTGAGLVTVDGVLGTVKQHCTRHGLVYGTVRDYIYKNRMSAAAGYRLCSQVETATGRTEERNRQ
jgi:hypothetical protein